MTVADEAARHGLHRVGGRPPLRQYLSEIWRRREFIYSLSRFRLEAEFSANRIGMGWIMLRPILNVAIYGLIFGVLLQTRRNVDSFIAFLVVGVMLFEFFQACFTAGAKSITSNQALVQSLSFPRLSLPLALVLQKLMQFIPTLTIVFVVAIANGSNPSTTWLLMIPLIALFTMFNLGLTFITARLTVHFRDLTQVLPFLSRMFFYTSGIFFSIEDRFSDLPTLQRIADWQPIHEVLTLGRAIMLDGPQYDIPVEYWAYLSVWAVGILIVGTIFFWSAEERYGRTD
ncbi:MAG TPA: ABC transporter permease [Aeromicrobium sp.]|nr:ABC transporter permease [Aeromicrobium sp.]